MPTTWILGADAARARLFALEDVDGGWQSSPNSAIVGETRHATVVLGRQSVDEFPLRNRGCRKAL